MSLIEYPTVRGRFEDMMLEGCRRFCGIIQLIKRVETDERHIRRRSLSFDTPECGDGQIIPCYVYGYPPEIYDAPCCCLP